MSGPVQSPSPRQATGLRRTAVICAAVVAGMVGMAYAAVPLYDLFCKTTGFGGTPRVATRGAATTTSRVITVRFDANVAPGLTMQFRPDVASIDAKVGETQTVFYTIRNTGAKPLTGLASFNVQPDLAGSYFNKIQCFCFNEMTLKPGETVDVPVVFFVDPAIEKDADLNTASLITLSYTFFPAKGAAKPFARLESPDKPKL
jgi:cytochrome c oxidase assembly protein subunit 11